MKSTIAARTVSGVRRSQLEPRDVQNRKDLAIYLSQSLSSQYRVFGEEDVSQTSTYIKSYIVEVHVDGTRSDQQQFASFFPQVLARTDPSLLLVFDRANVPFFVDVRDARFSVIHSIARTSETDSSVEQLTEEEGSGFDHAWMPTQFLLGARRGQLRGFKFSHQSGVEGVANPDDSTGDHGPIVDLAADELALDNIAGHSGEEVIVAESRPATRRSTRSRMSVSDNRTALRDYETIKSTGIFGGRQALDWIQYVAATAEGTTITNGVYANGKVIGNGTSIALHLLAVEGIRNAYATTIRRIEDDYAIGWVRSGPGRVLKGEPLIIQLPPELEIRDLVQFARSIFRSGRPFRLFGLPHSASENRIDVEAIDLHTGDPFSVEITPLWIRLYLPRGSCGNVVARLYANLQHSLNSDVSLATGSGEAVFTEHDAQ